MTGVNLTISQFTFIGEIALPLWLVIKGVNVYQWRETYAVAAAVA